MGAVIEHFRNRLASLGYPFRDIEFSLSYSQGDGMAFYGTLFASDIRVIAKRLLPPDSPIFEAFERAEREEIVFDPSISVERNHFGHHYANYGTMCVRGDARINLFDSSTTVELDKYYEEFQDLVKLIRRDVREISKALTLEGYAIQESCDPRWFAGLEDHVWLEKTIGRFTVQVQMREPMYFSLSDVVTDFDGNEITPEQVAESLASKQACAYSLIAQVFNSHTQYPIGEPVIEELVYDMYDLKLGRKVARELVSQAIENARAELERLTTRPTKSQRIA